MFSFQILEVGIGLALVYFILSLICQSINEWFASRLGMRAKSLEKAIRKLFNDPKKTEQFYSHSLITSLMDGERRPSYIPAKTFSRVLLDMITPSSAAEGITGIRGMKGAISQLSESEIKGALLCFFNATQENLAQVRKDIEDWYDSAMERVSGWYKRKIQWIILGISLGISGLLNADSFTIVNTLWRDDVLRASIVASAQKSVENPPSFDQDTSPRSIDELYTDLQKLNLPIGWVGRDNPRALKDDPRAVPDDFRSWVYKVIGIVVTALAASQGAGFWFDLMKKFVDLRGVGKKPEEEEVRKDKKPNS
ncbi:MAG: hypothetical protein AYP45_15585 [Candidatus Brocadia carolinensis]|uniref:Uncharacterized protein n=1 Tax=Candidatus Brocadia carolinensis TaxID=1004156 RepID=A0A1V4AQ91_9BACT|nr:MAG: hypothetical protein AYP45_15585 [Candidatus Brocadia caroliniensis]